MVGIPCVKMASGNVGAKKRPQLLADNFNMKADGPLKLTEWRLNIRVKASLILIAVGVSKIKYLSRDKEEATATIILVVKVDLCQALE